MAFLRYDTLCMAHSLCVLSMNLNACLSLSSLTLVELPFVTDDGIALVCGPPPPGLTQVLFLGQGI